MCTRFQVFIVHVCTFVWYPYEFVSVLCLCLWVFVSEYIPGTNSRYLVPWYVFMLPCIGTNVSTRLRICLCAYYLYVVGLYS